MTILRLEMTLEDMAEIKSQFIQAAKNADEAGFDMIELQAHHGFLLASFLSPLAIFVLMNLEEVSKIV